MERRINGPDGELVSPEDAAKWLGIPYTTFAEWVRNAQVPGPRVINKQVKLYPWETVHAIKVLIGVGFLPLPLPPKQPKENRSERG